MRVYLLTLLLMVTSSCFAQRELIHAKDPASLRSEYVRIDHFSLPETYGKYAGIRFMDNRYLKGYAGFFQQNIKSGFRKITTAMPFEDALNSSVKIRKDSSFITDSIVVVLKNFWMSRTSMKEEMNCHIKALFFTKRADTFFFRGKIDTLFHRHAIIKYELQDLPALFVEDLLGSFPLHVKQAERFYLQQDFYKLAAQPKQTAVDSLKLNGVFLSFGDFLKGKIHETVFSMDEFYGQYRISFENTGEGTLLAGKAWGSWYNGQLYIRQGKLYSKTFAAENTFLLLNNFKTSPAEDAYSCPVVLNMETGKLE